jgi:hypothetical protein
MKFNSTTVTISVGQHARRIFEDLDKMRPNHLSMSLFLAVVSEDYVRNHGLNTKMIDFIDNSNKNSLPIFYAPIKNWKDRVREMSPEDFMKLQERHEQLGNLIRKEGEKRI